MILRDSTNPFDIPLDGMDAVAGYGDGAFQWSSAGWARFPSTIVPLSIVVSASDVGDVLDVESGDATADQCPGWSDRFNRPGRRAPTIYCNRDTINAVRRAMGTRRFDWWCATLDGTKDVPGAVAVQYAGQNLTGGHYDESVIVDPTWIGRDSTVPDEPLVNQIFNMLFYGGDSNLTGPPYIKNALDGLLGSAQATATQLVEIKRLATTTQPTVDATAVATALAADAAFIDALASALESKIGAKLST